MLQTSVAFQAGDVLVCKDGVLDGNIDTLPVEIGTSGVLTVALSATEMNANRVVLKFTDQAGAQWCDSLIYIETTTSTLITPSQTAASVVSAVSGSPITIMRGDTLSAALTGLSSNTGYVSIDFTVKRQQGRC